MERDLPLSGITCEQGYEVSFRLKTDTAGMEEKIRNSRAVVVASADDV